MKTEVKQVTGAALQSAASLLRDGEVVAFPTETVYGLGADALSSDAVAKIFAAKDRPADNPLIAHIADIGMLDDLVTGVDARVEKLMDAFWPGPLTIVLPKTDRVPEIVSAGLDTVGVRMPAHPAAQALIRAAGCPVAAPSANRSGRPSPTTAAHVLEDMDGRIPLILDGGACGYGVESTVLDMAGQRPMVLRPGGVTVEMLREILPDVGVDPAVLAQLESGQAARSPGMRHRHYAPRADVHVVRGQRDAVMTAVAMQYDEAMAQGRKAVILCNTGHAGAYGTRAVQPIGRTAAEMAAGLFDALRMVDAEGFSLVLAEAIDTDGMGLAYMNRLLRAADFAVVDV